MDPKVLKAALATLMNERASTKERGGARMILERWLKDLPDDELEALPAGGAGDTRGERPNPPRLDALSARAIPRGLVGAELEWMNRQMGITNGSRPQFERIPASQGGGMRFHTIRPSEARRLELLRLELLRRGRR